MRRGKIGKETKESKESTNAGRIILGCAIPFDVHRLTNFEAN